MSELSRVTNILKARYLRNKTEFDAKARRLKKRNDKRFPNFMKCMQDKLK